MRFLLSILGLIVGFLVAFGAISLGEVAGHLVYPPPSGMDASNYESIKEHLHDLPLGAFVSVLVAWTLGVFLGSCLAALIARRGAYLHAGLIGFVFCAFSILTMAMIPHPIWFMISACAALPLATIAGGWLASLSYRNHCKAAS